MPTPTVTADNWKEFVEPSPYNLMEAIELWKTDLDAAFNETDMLVVFTSKVATQYNHNVMRHLAGGFAIHRNNATELRNNGHTEESLAEIRVIDNDLDLLFRLASKLDGHFDYK